MLRSILAPFSCTLLSIFVACCQPKHASPYPQNPTISDPKGQPHDTTTFYFPATDSLHAKYLPRRQWPSIRYSDDIRLTNCASQLEYASYALTYFEAPVLSNYCLGADIFRFLWLRSFHRPALLTLRHNSTGTLLRTQLLDKSPGFYILYVEHPDSLPPTVSARQRAYAKRNYDRVMADPTWLEQVAAAKRRAVQVTDEETTVVVTPTQWRQFQALLTSSQFYTLPACQPSSGMLDGADWLMEAHQTNSYHMVIRHSPDKNDAFRKACDYLINLSSIRHEERY